jgi:diguanylate cyclase (GGDEF)-like protein
MRMISIPRQKTNQHIRFLLMHQDKDFLNSRLSQFVAPFAPIAMIGAGTLIALTIAVQRIKQTPNPAILSLLLGIACVVSYALAPALRWSARNLRGNVACLLGCVYIATLATVVTVAFARASPDITGSLSFIVILAITPVVFWIKPWHYMVGFACAFVPSIIGMFVLDAPGAHWSLLLMVCIFAAFVGSLGLYVISACLYIIHEQNRALQMVSNEDDLTGLFRRRYWSEVAGQLLTRLAIVHQPATLLYIDLDGFKLINDTYGHAVGDDVLKMTATTLASTLPVDAVTGRPGGDEFLALLPGVHASEAVVIAALFQERLTEADPPANALNASIGIAAWVPGEALNELIIRADKGMLREKALNRLRYRELLAAAS